MSSTTTVPLGDLIEDALNILHQASQRPAQAVVGSTELVTVLDTQLTLGAAQTVSVPSLLEAAQELLLVTGKTTDPDPIYSVIRGYAGTPKNANYGSGLPLLLDPTWSRHRVRNAVVRCFSRVLNAKLPCLVTEQLSPVASTATVEMPANTVEVHRVFYLNPLTSQPQELDSWDFFDDVSTASSTGKLLRLAPQLARVNQIAEKLYVTYQVPYSWSGTDPADPAEVDMVELPLGAEELPGMYAAAFVLWGREMSRIQLDRTEEWPNEAAIRNGIPLRMVQQSWQAFYAALDETRSLQNLPRRIRFRPRRSI